MNGIKVTKYRYKIFMAQTFADATGNESAADEKPAGCQNNTLLDALAIAVVFGGRPNPAGRPVASSHPTRKLFLIRETPLDQVVLERKKRAIHYGAFCFDYRGSPVFRGARPQRSW